MRAVKGLLTNLGPILIYYAVFHFYGLRAAAVVTIVWCLGEIAYYRWKSLPMPKMFKFVCALTLIFGVLDIIFAEGLFVRLEPVITNLMMAAFFGYTLWSPKAIIQMIAAEGGQTSGFDSPDKRFLFRIITAFWTVYFVAKALVYLRFNFNSSIEEGILFRALVGNASLVAMFAISVLGARPLGRLLFRLGLMPSQKDAKLA